jgi:hypothetical protein
MLRKLLTLTLALGALALVPSAAMAANFCVGSSAPCTGSPHAPFTADRTGILDAVNAANANAGADTIFLAAGSYPLTNILTPTFTPAEDIHIIGAGVGQTVFTGSLPGAPMLSFTFPTTASSANGFSVEVTGTPANATGIQMFNGTLSDFAVNQPGGNASQFHAVALDSGATATRGSIALTSQSGIGLLTNSGVIGADDGNGNASEITMSGGAGASIGIVVDTSTPSGRNFDRLQIRGFRSGIEVVTGVFKLTNSLIDMGSINAAEGIDAFNGVSNSSISAEASRVTVVGSGPFQTALHIGATAAGSQDFTGGFSDLVLFASGETSNGLVCAGGGISVTATINSYAIRGAELNTGGCSPTKINKTDLNSTDPGFRSFTGGDFRLKPSSPLVDHGMVGESISSSERDLLGGTRVVDGDANGSSIVDLGAFEYQRSAPAVTASSGATSDELGDAVSFQAVGSDPDGDALTFAWRFDEGGTASGNTASHVFSTPGPHVATVVATDETGLTASATAFVQILPLASATIAAKPKKAFKRGKKGFSVAKKGQPSFSVAFANAAKAKFTLQSVAKNKKLKSIKGSQTISVKSGTTKFFFGGKKLKAGKYRVTITPLSSTGKPGNPVAVEIKLK